MSRILSIIINCYVVPSRLLFNDRRMSLSDLKNNHIRTQVVTYESNVLELYNRDRIIRKFRIPFYLMDVYEGK